MNEPGEEESHPPGRAGLSSPGDQACPPGRPSPSPARAPPAAAPRPPSGLQRPLRARRPPSGALRRQSRGRGRAAPRASPGPYLLAGPPFPLHLPLEALGPLLRVVRLLLQDLDLALHRLDGGDPGHGAHPAPARAPLPASSARRCSRGSPHFRCSALKYRNSPTLPDVTSPPPPPRPPHPRPAGRPAVARSGGGARAAPPGRQGRPAPLFPGPAKGGGAGTGGRHGNRKARRGLAGPARLAASVPPLRSRRRPLSPRPRAAPSPPARRGAPHPLYDANVLRASAATHPTQAPKPDAEKILHPRLRKSPALPPPFKVRPGEEDTVCPHLIKKELCRGSLHWGPEHPFSVITVSTFPAASASRNCLSNDVCMSPGASVAPSPPRSRVRLAGSLRCSWNRLLTPACWLFSLRTCPQLSGDISQSCYSPDVPVCRNSPHPCLLEPAIPGASVRQLQQAIKHWSRGVTCVFCSFLRKGRINSSQWPQLLETMGTHTVHDPLCAGPAVRSFHPCLAPPQATESGGKPPTGDPNSKEATREDPRAFVPSPLSLAIFQNQM